jgi:hydrogenase large subunit
MQLKPGQPVHTAYTIPQEGEGVGLTEAPRGALGHWISVENKRIGRYQCVVPTTWNAGPRDDEGKAGPMEQALIGTPIADAENPIEAARVVRSFDPCIACAVHVVTPDRKLLSRFRIS